MNSKKKHQKGLRTKETCIIIFPYSHQISKTTNKTQTNTINSSNTIVKNVVILILDQLDMVTKS